MARMVKFMVVHKAPDLSWDELEEKWKELADVESAIWDRTWFNKKEGVRYCLWRAPDSEVLKQVFADLDVTWESILQVLETVPEVWKTEMDEYYLGPT
jgi:hypothetical protein